MTAFSQLDIVHEGKILIAYLNRPQKANALNRELWFEIEKLAHWVDESPDIRVLILAGHGNHFTSGIDFSLIQDMSTQFQQKPKGIRQEWLYREIRKLQDAFTALENCAKPVLAAVHGSCIGGGVDDLCLSAAGCVPDPHACGVPRPAVGGGRGAMVRRMATGVQGGAGSACGGDEGRCRSAAPNHAADFSRG